MSENRSADPIVDNTGHAAVLESKSLGTAVARLVSAAALLTGLAATGALVARHLGQVELPGCSLEGSGCAEVEASRWANVAGWPIADLGFGYFVALVAAWWLGASKPSRFFLWMARLGALISAGFTVLLVVEGQFCAYCAASHAANFALWLSAEWRRPTADLRVREPLGAGAVLLTVLFLLHWAEGRVSATAQRGPEAVGQVESAGPTSPQPAVPPRKLVFAERYRLGPANAPVHLLLIGDYQCDFCTQADAQLRAMVAKHPGRISLSMKHFPMCSDCNWAIRKTRHRNSCRAAQAAQAAGMLQGNDGFWRMHDWLCRVKGEFKEADLRAALPKLGFADPDGFLVVMTSAEILARINDDVSEVEVIDFTKLPVIAVNGVEMRVSALGNKLDRAIEAAVEKSAPAGSQ